MPEIKISILIATMPSRAAFLSELMQILSPQLTKEIELIVDDSMGYNIGVKRQHLLELAMGEYVVAIDDDDLISPNYISAILNAIKTKPDCIGMNGVITRNGGNERKWFISKEYLFWHEKNGQYLRTPNHISPVKRELALKAGFPPISFAEDKSYSDALLPYLKTEVVIDEPLYHYRFRDK